VKRIAIVQGHPDPAGSHLCHALCAAYADAAREAGHEVRQIDVASLDFPLLRTAEDFDRGTPPAAIAGCQETIAWAEHLVVVFPMWLGEMPALLKAFMEQLFRPSFAGPFGPGGGAMKGKSARIVMTMGMPALVYRWWFGAHGLKNLERSILGLIGFAPVRATLFGGVADGRAQAPRWLGTIGRLARRAR
jgi:putative NADPH-quinone reductase